MEKIANAFDAGVTGLFDKVNSGIMFVNEDRNIVYANRYFLNLFDTEMDEIQDRKCWSVMHPENPTCRKCETMKDVNLEVDINGNPINVFFTNSLVKDDLLLKIIQDISKLMESVTNVKEEISKLKNIIENTFGNSEFLTACSVCTKVRLRDGSWVSAKNMDNLKSGGWISHGLCPECAKPFIDDIMKKKK